MTFHSIKNLFSIDRTHYEGQTSAGRLAFNVIFNVLATVIDSLLSFFLIPFFIVYLHKEGYGIWSLVGTFFTYSVLIQLSISGGISRYVAFYEGKNDNEAIHRIMATGNICFAVAGLILLIVTFIGTRYFGQWFQIPQHLLFDTKWMVFIVGMSWVIIMPFQSFPAALCGYQCYGFFRGVNLIGNIVRAGLIFLALPFGIGLIGTGIIYGTVQIVVRLLLVIFSLRFLGPRSFSFWPFDCSLFWEMISYGINVIFYELGIMIIYRVANVLIGIFMLISNVTEYNVLVSLLIMLSALTQTFNTAITPAIANLQSQNNPEKIKEFYLVLQKFNILFVLPSIGFFIVMGQAFLTVWVGPEFSGLWPVLTVLCVGHFFRLLQDCNFKVLCGMNHHKFYGSMVLIVAIVITVASIFVLRQKLGLMGIAWANTIFLTLFFGIVMEIYFHKKLSISLKQMAAMVWYPSFLGCFPAITWMILWRVWRTPTSWAEIFLVALIAGILVVVFSWLWSMTDNEKNKIKSLVLERIYNPKC
ncbi:MAG: oligosaccharide flippase family protein [Phycisphaerae bacterium]